MVMTSIGIRHVLFIHITSGIDFLIVLIVLFIHITSGIDVLIVMTFFGIRHVLFIQITLRALMF